MGNRPSKTENVQLGKAMEESFQRFSHLSEKIFEHLDYISITKCRKVNKKWQNYLDDGKIIRFKIIQSIRSTLEKFQKVGKSWDEAFNTLNTDALRDLGVSVKKVYIEKYRTLLENLNLTPLHIAAIIGQLKMVKCIMIKLEDKNPRINDGRTPLHAAAFRGHLNIVKYLMEVLKDKIPRDNAGNTPLHFAAENGQFKVSKYIIDNVEDKNPANNTGSTPLDFAYNNSFYYYLYHKFILFNAQ